MGSDTGNITSPPPQTGGAQARPEMRAKPAGIVLLPTELQSLPRDIRLDGEVVRIDTTAREIAVRTPRGEIVLHLPENVEMPAQGQKISVTLPAGAPPEQAYIHHVRQTQPPPPVETAAPPRTLTTGDTVTAVLTEAPAAAAEEAALRASQKIREALMQNGYVRDQAGLPQSRDLAAAAVIAAMAAAPRPEQPATQTQKTGETAQPPQPQQVATPMTALLSMLDDGVLRAAPQSAPLPKTPAASVEHLQDRVFRLHIEHTAAATPAAARPVSGQPEEAQAVIRITGHSAGGLPLAVVESSQIAQLPAGTDIVLQTPAAVKPDAVLTVTAQTLSPEQFVQQLQNPSFTPASATTTTQIPPLTQPLLSTIWPALQEVLHISDALAAPQTAAALRQTLPSPASPARLIPTVLFFIAALRMGNLEGWMGERHLDTLRQAGRQDLIARLAGDFRNIAQQAREFLTGDWRGIALPMLEREEIQMIQLYTRQQQKDEEKDGATEQDGNTEKTTRFLLNLRLDRLGDVQIDGFLRHKKTLDVFLRTKAPLDAETHQELRKAFHSGLESAGLSGGEIVFQNEERLWVKIPARTDDAVVTA
ncbi:MAG: hypothetical protein EA357_07880 [Micavibrio sp.]|nr:MAG: hypothetical protein EA357_07880 [Micavibrio sp.]